MKHSYVSFFLLIALLSNAIIAQNYIPFPTQNARWKMVGGGSFCMMYGNITISDYYLNGDTTINNQSYHKIYSSEYFIACNMPSGGFNHYIPSHYTFSIRESNKKIYQTDGQTERLVYDFDLQLGDTLLNKGYNTPNNPYARVVTIDSTFWANQWRKRYHIFPRYFDGSTEVDTFYLTEGIGSSLGFGEYFQEMLDYPTSLLCVNFDGQIGGTLYEPACMPTTSIFPFSSQKNKLKIQPNPLENEGYIFFPDENEQYELSIFDINGRQALAQKQLQTSFFIERTTLQSGVYLLYVKDRKGEIIVQKLWVR